MGYIPINDMKVTRDLKGNVTKIKELGKNERSSKKMLTKSKNSRLEKIWENHYLSMYEFDCCRRCHDFDFRGPKGLSTFFVNKVNIFSFLFGSSWNPAAKEFGSPTNDS